MSKHHTYQAGDRIRTTVPVSGDYRIPAGSLGTVLAAYPDQFGAGQQVDVRLDGIPAPARYYAVELDPAPEEPAAPVDRAISRRFRLVRDVDVTGVTGTGPVADGVMWPDGTASVRWRGDHPSIVFWDRGWESVERIHGHGGHTRIEWVDPDPAELGDEEAGQ